MLLTLLKGGYILVFPPTGLIKCDLSVVTVVKVSEKAAHRVRKELELVVKCVKTYTTLIINPSQAFGRQRCFLATGFIEDFASNFIVKTIQINTHSITEIMT